MRFNFCTSNHHPTGRQTLVDMYRWLRAGLEELGHEVTLSDAEPDSHAINVFWEYFEGAEHGARLAGSGLDYGLIVTEFIDGAGFNRGTPQSTAADPRDEGYRQRWQGFVAAACNARFFWSMVESNVPALRQRAPAGFVELGYSERLIPKHLEEPSIDFSFTGIMTPYRAGIIAALRKYADVVCPEKLLPVAQRDALFHATRVNLSPNKMNNWQMPSPIRAGMAVLSKRGIALDRTPQQTRQSRLVGVRPEGMSFVDYALAQRGANWRAAAEVALERYRAEMPMRQITERLLDETLLSQP